ncbi:helix-turn-helix domain-containing protein [Micromonospora taraxaci]|uniref:helix-turn-helix domain-containing protein n=1 Tax=Micromonospora taraxaci TaxID=1316803 RepID=UPI003C2D1660
MDEQDGRARLAEFIKTRRLERGLSTSKAAQAAGIDRATWSTAESGARRTSEHNWAGIERALGWATGSIAAILNGGNPTPVQDQAVDEEIELVRTDPKLTEDVRERIIALILERRERDKAAALDDTRRLIDLFKRS